MRYALISDVHGNLPALEAVVRDIASRGADATYHLGDLVGYAPWPDEVVRLLADEQIPGISGNYDTTVATGYKHCGCQYEDARQEELSHLSYVWTLAHVSADTRRALAALPFRLDLRPLGGHIAGPTVTLLHGNQVLNTVYVHASRSDAFLEKLGQAAGARAGDVVCVGHTHVAWTRVIGGVRFVNTGSVGRPKDGDWRAGYALLDAGGEETSVELVRVEYDVERAASAIRESDLPDELADFLRAGGRPGAEAHFSR